MSGSSSAVGFKGVTLVTQAGGAANWVDLNDTPGSITALQFVRGNAGGTALEFVPASSVDHGSFGGLSDDDHLQYLLLAGRSGGQAAIGGTGASEELNLRGTTNANLGQIRLQSPIDFDDTSAANALNPYFVQANPTQTFTAGFVGGGANYSPTIDFSNAFFIWEGMKIAPRITSGVAPSFAAFTLLNALPVLRSTTTGFSPLNALTLNIGVTIENAGVAVALTTTSNFGVSFSPQTRVTGIFSTMTVENQTAVSCQPTFSTVNTSVANLGTIRGLHCKSPIVALFQPGAGTENMTAYIGLDMDNITFGGTVEKTAVRSAQPAATNSYFLRQTGNAQSILLGNMRFQNDLVGISFGLSDDINIGWSAANFFYLNFATGNVGQLRFSSELPGVTTDRYLIEGFVQSSEININCDRFTLGAQSASVGNQVGIFTAPARTVSISGGWSDFLLTQAGNITVNATLSQLVGWTINAPTIVLGTGSVTDAAALLVGGNVNQGTNRYGMLISSNPSGGTLNYALRCDAGDARFDGKLQFTGILECDPTTVTGTTHTAGDEHVILVDDDAAGSQVTVTLPPAGDADAIYHVKKLGTTANLIVDGDGTETIDGALTMTISVQYDSVMIVSDGSNWHII